MVIDQMLARVQIALIMFLIRPDGYRMCCLMEQHANFDACVILLTGGQDGSRDAVARLPQLQSS